LNENILKFINKYFPNKYKNIILHSDYILDWEDEQKIFFYGVPVSTLILFAIPFFLLTLDRTIPFYSMLFTLTFYIALVFILLYNFIFIKEYYNIMYRTKYKLPFSMLRPFFGGLFFILGSITLFFFIYDYTTELYIINTIFVTYISLGIASSIYYAKYWSKIYNGDEYNRNLKLLKRNNFIYDKHKIEFKKPKTLEKKKKEKSILIKWGEKILYPIVGVFFSVPTLVAVSATGSLNGGEAYLVGLFTLILLPYFIFETQKLIYFYKFIKKIEKDENVIIYNGRW